MQKIQILPVVAAFTLTLLMACGCSQLTRELSKEPGNATGSEASWHTYEGAWFTVRFPREFSVKPSLPTGELGQFDSVFFIAPDNQVSFYVLSPQWRRVDEKIALQSASEIQKEEFKRLTDGFIEESRIIRALDGSYERLIESYTSENQTVSWTFQFRYTNSKARMTYEKQYEQFKVSLDQYTD